jgi:hypothetical protein
MQAGSMRSALRPVPTALPLPDMSAARGSWVVVTVNPV